MLWGLLTAALLVFAMATGSVTVQRLLLALLTVPLFGYVSSVLAARRLEGSVRRITPFLQVGQTLVEELQLRSLHWWPKLLLEADHQSKPFGSSGRILTLWPYRTATWTAEKHCERRGVYEYGEIEVTARDPLGLFARSVRLGKRETALVYPATFDLPGFFVPAGQGFTEGANQGRTFMPSPVAGGIREYVSGDSMGQIHWPATARARKLMTKLFEREPSGPFDAVWVLLDLHSDVQAGSGTESTVEYGVTVAASILKRFLDAGRPVGLVAAGEERFTFKPASGVTQLGRALEALALIQPGRAASLPDMAAETAEEIVSGSSVVIVSPSPVELISAAATKLQATGAGVVPVVLDRGSFAEGPAAKRMEQVRVSGAAFEAYVVHMGDEIPQRLDHRLYGSSMVLEAAPAGMLP